jgi:hypothetical protein
VVVVMMEQAQFMWKCGQVECLSASWPLRNALGMLVWAHQKGWWWLQWERRRRTSEVYWVVVCVLRMQGNGWLVGWRSVAAATNLGGPANKQNEWMLMFGRETTEETINQYDMRHYSSTMTSFTQASGYIHRLRL